MSVEPVLHPMTGETLTRNSAIKSEEARLEIAARGFGVPSLKAFFDVRVFNPLARRWRIRKSPKRAK